MSPRQSAAQRGAQLPCRRQRTIAHAGDVFVGERPVVGAHAQRERQRLLAFRYLRPGVDVEQAHTLQQRATSGAQGQAYGFGGEILVHHQRHVLLRHREGRDPRGSSNRLRDLDQSAQVDLCRTTAGGQIEGRHDIRVQLARVPESPARQALDRLVDFVRQRDW